MADTKITALLSPQVTTNPATDVLPIVNIADPLMAASGSTRKITVNQLLGAGGTATLASATITGDLTVDTSTLKVDSANDRVGIKIAIPAAALHVASGNIRLDNGYQLEFGGTTNSVAGSNATNTVQIYTNNVERYNINSTGVATWSNVGGVAGTAMTLNSTGLAIGGSAFSISRLTLVSSASNDCLFSLQKSGTARTAVVKTDGTNLYLSSDSGATGNKISLSLTAPDSSLSIDSSGNVVVGTAAIATTATNGFLYVTGCAGTPTGTPTTQTGRVPLVVDTTNNKLYFYSGGSWVAAN